MRTHTMPEIKKISIMEMLKDLTRSLAFQVQMIMWEDKKNRHMDTQGSITTENGYR